MMRFLAIAIVALPLVGFAQQTGTDAQQGQSGTQQEPMGQSATGTAGETQRADQQKDQARVVFINSIPGSQAVNVVAQGQPLFSNVQFGKASEAKTIPAKDMKINIVSTDGKQVFAENHDLSLSANKDFTVVATGRITDDGKRKVHTDVIAANKKDLGADKTFVAFVNGSPMGKELTLRVDGKETIRGVNALSHDTSRDIAPGSHRLEIASGDRGTIAGPMQVNFTPGRAYTIVASGSQMAGGAAPGTAPGGTREREPGMREEGARAPSEAGQLMVSVFDDTGKMISGPGQTGQEQQQMQQQPSGRTGQEPQPSGSSSSPSPQTP